MRLHYNIPFKHFADSRSVYSSAGNNSLYSLWELWNKEQPQWADCLGMSVIFYKIDIQISI